MVTRLVPQKKNIFVREIVPLFNIEKKKSVAVYLNSPEIFCICKNVILSIEMSTSVSHQRSKMHRILDPRSLMRTHKNIRLISNSVTKRPIRLLCYFITPFSLINTMQCPSAVFPSSHTHTHVHLISGSPTFTLCDFPEPVSLFLHQPKSERSPELYGQRRY